MAPTSSSNRFGSRVLSGSSDAIVGAQLLGSSLGVSASSAEVVEPLVFSSPMKFVVSVDGWSHLWMGKCRQFWTPKMLLVVQIQAPMIASKLVTLKALCCPSRNLPLLLLAAACYVCN